MTSHQRSPAARPQTRRHPQAFSDALIDFDAARTHRQDRTRMSSKGWCRARPHVLGTPQEQATGPEEALCVCAASLCAFPHCEPVGRNVSPT